MPAILRTARPLRGVVKTWTLRRHPALTLTLVSLCLWATFQLVRPLHRYGDLSRGKFTDHFSHMTSTRLFVRVGIDIWRRPLRDNGRPFTAKEKEQLPADIDVMGNNYEAFAVDGWPIQKPLLASWTHLPRLHPPGDLLLLAPVAMAYSWTPLSFSAANRLLILSFLIYAHVSLFFLFQGWLSAKKSAIGFLTVLLVYGEVLHWTLEGFYEAAVLAPLFLCAKWLHEKRMLAAIVAYSVAVTIHFRAFFFAPWAVYAAFAIWRDGTWRTWRLRDQGAALAAALLAGASLGVFALVWPTLRAMPIVYSPLALAPDHTVPLGVRVYVVVLVVVAVALIHARAWLDVVVLGWVTFIFFSLHEAYEWDVLTLLAWLGAPLGGPPKRAAMARDARLYFVLFCSVFLFRSTLLPLWIGKLL